MPHALSPEDVPSFQGERLYVNDGLLRASQVGQLRESPANLPMEELRRRYQEDGYVFLKGLLPRSDVLAAREEYFKMLAPSGVLKPGTQPVEGIFDNDKNAEDFPGIGSGASPGNGKPGEATAEKFIFLRHGEPTSVTAWVPMGDIGLTGGGLIYLENGHTLGRQVEADFNRKAAESGLSEEETRNAFNQNMLSTGLLADGPREYSDTFDRRWLVTKYEAGDVVLHNPYAIHASTVNFDPNNVIRVGTDLRFVDGSKPWDTRWDKDYSFNDGV
ncbi:phytanoyl- hydroxylase [Pyrenophora seminiperda CCB06]|uniref:Phytanoyl-hydroxylase n=1 Tax=Pyrenophora seminiperda CCB06 TaxID=1302712 RepID=A0A3M7LY84_9PLEO|nr:phytanoyl- hydroxylase [Pyrenophora seminiperda CCB06]